MRIFVTGGTGFIGKYVVAELQKQGHKLLVLSRKNAIEVFPFKRNLAFLRGGLSSPGGWRRKLAAFRPQAAIHMAWEGIPDYEIENSVGNLLQGLHLFRMLGEVGCRKVIATGSCWEYGRDSGKMKEDMDPRPMNAFSAAKTALQWLGRETAKEYGMEFVWARIFYVYGPEQRLSSLIPHLIEEKRRGAPPALKNPDGGNDFVYVGDVARGLRLLVEKKTPHAVYNIGSGRLTGVREVARAVYGKDIVKRKGPAKGFYADIARIKKDLGWKPTVSVAAGIRTMIE